MHSRLRPMIKRLEDLEKKIRPGEKRLPDWMTKNSATALFAVAIMSELESLGEHEPRMPDEEHYEILTRLCECEDIGKAMTTMDRLLRPWRTAQTPTVPIYTEDT